MMRRLRAVLVVALLWALVWLPMGAALAWYAEGRPPQPSDVIFRPVSVPLFVIAWSAWGWVSGALFAVTLSIAERRRRLADLSLPRSAVWGAVGAMATPAMLTAADLVRGPFTLGAYHWRFALLALAISAGVGAACGAVTLALARRGS